MTRFEQALSYLLPPGQAWPRDPRSVWMRLLYGIAAVLDEHDQWVQQAVREWMPHTTHTRLAEWEEATGLPDGCFGAAQPYEVRQARLLRRLRGAPRFYDDSSPASLAAMEALCAEVGQVVKLTRPNPFRVGRNRVGQRLGVNSGRVFAQLAGGAGTRMRVGLRVGRRLYERPAEAVLVACVLEPVLPARFQLVLGED